MRRATDISTTELGWAQAGPIFAAYARNRFRRNMEALTELAKGPAYAQETMFDAFDKWLEAIRATVPEEERP